MLLVKTKVAPSTIEGLGLFADQFIPKGTHIWRYEPTFDHAFSQDYIDNLDELGRDFMRRYAYKSPYLNKYVLCGDDARFYNHSDEPNTGEVAVDGEVETRAIALRDIQLGEELTIDYRIMEGTDEPVF